MIEPSILEVAPEGAPITAGLFTAALALAHLFMGAWETIEFDQKRQWLSAAGGATVAYVCVLLLPEVSEAALRVGELRGEALLAEQYVYLMALAGFVIFYGVEVAVAHRASDDLEDTSLVFWAHVAIFALYSGLIGYLLFHQETTGVLNQFFYALAMGLHFGITDYGLRRHHGRDFDRIGRWILAEATLVGGGVGVVLEIGDLVLSTLFGFVAGAVVLNVIKEELPESTESRFLAFALGAAVYTVVLVLA